MALALHGLHGVSGHALAFEGRGLRHGGDALFQQRPGLYARHAWTRAAPASLMLHGLQLSPGGSGALRVERRETGAGGCAAELGLGRGARRGGTGGLAAGRAAGGAAYLSWAGSRCCRPRPRRPVVVCRGSVFSVCYCAVSDERPAREVRPDDA